MTKEVEVIHEDDKGVIDDGMTHFFKRPFTFEGKEYKHLDLKMDQVTGGGLERAEIQFSKDLPELSAQTPLKELSKPFLVYFIAEATRLPIEFFKEMPAVEYSAITRRAQTFLLSGE